MYKFISKNNIKFLTLALGLLGSINKVRATDCEIFQSAVTNIIKFNNPNDCCSYNGVKCENIGGVNSITEIKLEKIACSFGEKTLLDNLITSFTNLKNLKKFEINKPNFCSFPKNLCQLKTLKSLTVNMSFSETTLPECLSDITNLEELDFTDCQLKGQIPESYGNLKNLKILKLGGNNLSGYIPYSFNNLKNLEELYLERNTEITGYIPEMPKIKTCNYMLTNLCKSETTTCTEDLKFCTKEILETSNKNNGNPDPNNFDYSKEYKKHHRTKITYIPCTVCLVVVIFGILYEIFMRKTHDKNELVDVTSETRNKYNHVISSRTTTMTLDRYLKETRIGIALVAIAGIVIFFVLE